MQQGYSLEPMVGVVKGSISVLLVHIDNIPDFFIEIAGHPCLILPQTLEQKKRLGIDVIKSGTTKTEGKT